MDEDAINDIKIRINNLQGDLQMHEASRKNVEATLNTVIPQLMDMHKKTLEKVERGEIDMEVYRTMENDSRQKVAAMEQTLIDGAFMEDACRQHIKKLEDKLNSGGQQSDSSIGSEEFGGNPDGQEENLDEFSLEAPTHAQPGTPPGTPRTPPPFQLEYDPDLNLDGTYSYQGGKRRPRKKKRKTKRRKTKRRKTKRRKTKRKTRRRN